MSPAETTPLACTLALLLGLGSAAARGAEPSAPPYHVDHTAPLDATERLVTETLKYAQYRVEFNGIRRDRVPAFVYVPRDGKAVHPAVLLQYGSGGNKSTYY